MSSEYAMHGYNSCDKNLEEDRYFENDIYLEPVAHNISCFSKFTLIASQKSQKTHELRFFTFFYL